MPRPLKPRWLQRYHNHCYFGPLSEAGPQQVENPAYDLTLDELEALRLADAEGMHQAEAAQLMNVSRQTFGRIITAARGKVARALVQGRGIHIRGGEVRIGQHHRGRQHGPPHGNKQDFRGGMDGFCGRGPGKGHGKGPR
jgi:predicted DNA-binding protein (UPF0251 family)